MSRLRRIRYPESPIEFAATWITKNNDPLHLLKPLADLFGQAMVLAERNASKKDEDIPLYPFLNESETQRWIQDNLEKDYDASGA